MKLSIVFFLLSGLLAPGLTQAYDSARFMASVREKSAIYQEMADSKEIHSLMQQGRIEEANNLLISLVPNKDKTASDYFFLGNMLYQIDPERSGKLMMKAERLDTENPFVWFERGMHEHRKGNYRSAQDYYLAVIDSGVQAESPVLPAYLAHVYLMLNQPEDALAVWSKVNFRQHHTSIEKAMYPIFSDRNQEAERTRLISRIRRGEKALLCDLAALDSEWESDWWNYAPRESYLAFDDALAGEVLDPDAPLAVIYSLCRDADTVTPGEYLARVKGLGLIDGEQQLPGSPRFVYDLVRHLLSEQEMSAEEVMARWERRLLALAKSDAEAKPYYDVLAHLYVSTGNQEALREVDLHGWKKLHEPNYAISYLVGVADNEALLEKSLKAALKDFPHSEGVARIELQTDPESIEVLSHYVATQFANVKENWAGPYRLGDYMSSLSVQLKKLK